MKSVLKVFAVASLLALAATAAQAQAYLGGSVGPSAMVPTVAEDSIDKWNAVVYGPGNDCETLRCTSETDPSAALKFYGGYRVNPYFAAEGFLAYLGTFNSYAFDGFSVDSYAIAEVGTLGVAAVGMIPVSGRVSLLGKLGVHGWSSEGTVDLWDWDLGEGFVGSFDESGTDLMGGIGVDIDFGGQIAMRVEFEYFALNADYTDFGIGFLSVGAMYKF